MTDFSLVKCSSPFCGNGLPVGHMFKRDGRYFCSDRCHRIWEADRRLKDTVRANKARQLKLNLGYDDKE